MSYISKYELEALGEPLGDCVTTPKLGGGYICGGGGGGGPSSTTVTQSTIPEWLRPQTEMLLGGAMQELFTSKPTGAVDASGNPIYDITGVKPYTPYSGKPEEYVAGFTPAQQSAVDIAMGMQEPGEYAAASGLASQAGGMGRDLSMLGLGYGGTGMQAGQLGQQLATSGGAYYGGLGAGYGGQAAQLAPSAFQYGALGSQYGNLASQLALQRGDLYAGRGAEYGALGAGLAPEAQYYGRTAADIGGMGLRAEQLGRDVTGQARGYAGQSADIGGLYERMATSPSDVGRFMSPYTEMLTKTMQEGAVRQADIARQARKSAAARAGAYGGARQAIEEAEANRALQSQLQGIESQNLMAAYGQAQANILNRAQLGLQGLSGAQQGLGTALQGGQLGLSGIGQAMAGQQAGLAGLGQAGQLYGLGMQGTGLGLQALQQQLAGTAQGMQGAGMGMQGVGQAGQMYGLGMQGAGMGLQGIQQQLAGTAQGMQGAGVGLQGVQSGLAGAGLGSQAASQLAQIGGQRLGSQADIANLRYGLGTQQQQLNQAIINQAIQNFALEQETPYQRLAQFNALLRGYAIPGQVTTAYQAAPPLGSQLAGIGTAGAGLAGLVGGGKKAGGTVRAGDGVDTLALNRALAGD